MRSLVEDDEVFSGDLSIDEVSSCAIFLLLLCLYRDFWMEMVMRQFPVA